MTSGSERQIANVFRSKLSIMLVAGTTIKVWRHSAVLPRFTPRRLGSSGILRIATVCREKQLTQSAALRLRLNSGRGVHDALALAQAEDGHPDDALATIQRAKSAGDYTPLYGWPVGSASMLDRPTEASNAYTALASLEGHQRFARLQLAKCYLMEGQLDTAVEQLESDLAVDVLKRDSANEAHRRWWLGHLYGLLGDNKSAILHARELVDRPAAPAQLLALRYGAFLAHHSDNSEMLRATIQKLDRIQTSYPSTRSQGYFAQASGWMASLQGDSRTSRSRHARARALWPDVLNSFSFAQCLLDAADYAGAAAGFEGVIKAKGPALLGKSQWFGWQRMRTTRVPKLLCVDRRGLLRPATSFCGTGPAPVRLQVFGET